MKVIIAGSRTIKDMKVVAEAVKLAGFAIDEVVVGGATGVDAVAAQWAYWNKIPVMTVPALWDEFGRAAGPIRNRKMAEYSDALIAVWDGTSPGTKNMIEEATKRGLKIYIHKFPADPIPEPS